MGGYALALDVGNRRIGVAASSLIAKLPAPHSVIDRSINDPLETIKTLVEEIGAEVVVIGLPRDINGIETEQTAIVREFATKLKGVLNVPIVMQDEAVTSVEAEKRLQVRGKPYDKGDIDAEAAAMILDDYFINQDRNIA